MRNNASILDLIPRRNDLLLAYRIINGKDVIVDLVHGTLNTLNTTATRIWELTNGEKSIKEIVDGIVKEFEISVYEAEDDILDIFKEMSLKGWIVNFPIVGVYKENGNEMSGKVFEELREEAMKKQIPLIAHFDLTYRCNLDCVHCYVVCHSERPECTTQEIKHILDQLAKKGVLYITFSGGEIFLRKDLLEILSCARDLHFSVRLLTNGTLADENSITEIATLHPELVAFSIYDMNPEIHDSITNSRKSFERTVNTIQLFKKKNIPLKISTVLMRGNVERYHEIYNFAEELKAQFQADIRITPKTDGSLGPLAFHISDDKIKEVLSDPVFSREGDPEPEQGYYGIFDTIPCGAGHMSCYISPYGDVTPCVQVPVVCGNLKDQLFLDIWNNSPKLREFRRITFSQINGCAECKLFAYCRPCPGCSSH